MEQNNCVINFVLIVIEIIIKRYYREVLIINKFENISY